MECFLEFVDRKQREARRHLRIIEAMLKKSGLNVKGHLDDDEPYVFLKTTNNKLSFEGVRIYQVGSIVAYRCQQEEKTEPYGKAYMLNLEEMFNDFMSENMKEEDAGKKVIHSVLLELKNFFEKSAEAEKELKQMDFGNGGLIVRTGGTDYSSLVFSKA